MFSFCGYWRISLRYVVVQSAHSSHELLMPSSGQGLLCVRTRVRVDVFGFVSDAGAAEVGSSEGHR